MDYTVNVAIDIPYPWDPIWDDPIPFIHGSDPRPEASAIFTLDLCGGSRTTLAPLGGGSLGVAWELPGENRAPNLRMSGFPQVEAIGGETSNIFWECSPVHPRNLGGS